MDSLTALFGATPVAATLLAIVLAASLVGLYAVPSVIDRGLFRPHWFLPRREFATPVTSAFLHADLAHLAFNSFTFWAFGFALERSIGSIKFGLLYAVGIAVSSFGTWLVHRRDPGYRTLGASGAILAVLFASIVYNPFASIYMMPFPVPIPAPVFAVLYLGYSIWASRQGGGRVNHDAHLSGALAGVAFVVLVDPGAFAQAWSRVFG